MQKQGLPCLVARGTPSRARPLSRHRQRGEFDESWLQELIHGSPDLLPVTEIDSRVSGALHSLGREIETPSGPVDNLLLSESGHLVVVETKLWRNPEARRKVVAQILDYAAHVRRWDYSDIEALWSKAHPGTSLARGVQAEDEAEWVDRVQRNLAAGRMTLLVVGDGIESRAESLAATVAASPDFQFRLALVELRVFELSDEEFLVVPNTLARTHEIERATVRVVYGTAGPPPQVEVSVPSPTQEGTSSGGARTTLEKQAFLEELEATGESGAVNARVVAELLRRIDEVEELDIEWKSAGFAIKAQDPVVEGARLSLAVVSRPNTFYVFWPWLRGQIERGWGTPEVAERLARRLGKFATSLGARETRSGEQLNVDLTSLRGREEQVVAGLRLVVEDIAREGQRVREE